MRLMALEIDAPDGLDGDVEEGGLAHGSAAVASAIGEQVLQPSPPLAHCGENDPDTGTVGDIDTDTGPAISSRGWFPAPPARDPASAPRHGWCETRAGAGIGGTTSAPSPNTEMDRQHPPAVATACHVADRTSRRSVFDSRPCLDTSGSSGSLRCHSSSARPIGVTPSLADRISHRASARSFEEMPAKLTGG